MRRSAIATAVTSVGVLVGSALVSASPASAGQTWHQSVERSSASAECPANSQSDRDAGWTDWAASWEEWAKNGKGGWTCTRSITWAKDTPPPSSAGSVPANLSGCVLLFEDEEWLDFGTGSSVSIGDPVWADPACTVPDGPSNYNFVLVPVGGDADQLCRDAFGPGYVAGRDQNWQSGINDCSD